MKIHRDIEVEIANHEVKCPNCGTWLAFPWYRFVRGEAGKCQACGSYHKDVNILELRDRSRS